MMNQIMTRKEVREELKIAESTMWRWVKTGILPAPKHDRWLREDILRVFSRSTNTSSTTNKKTSTSKG